MRDPRLERETQAGGPGLPKDKNLLLLNKSLLAVSRHHVNLSGLSFRLRPIAGLGLAGGWCDRLTLWIPLVDMTAKLLRAVAEGRI